MNLFGIACVLEDEIMRCSSVSGFRIADLNVVSWSASDLAGCYDQPAGIWLCAVSDPDLKVYIVLAEGERVTLGPIDDAASEIFRVIDPRHQFVISRCHQQIGCRQRQFILVLQLVY